jgi:hypothetical protein
MLTRVAFGEVGWDVIYLADLRAGIGVTATGINGEWENGEG